MTAILLLFLVGVALLAADVFVSSFLLAILGGCVMLAGCGVAYHNFGFIGAVVGGLSAAALLGGTVYAELFLLPKTRFGRGLVVHATSGPGGPPPLAAADVVGAAAVALTTLAPSGYVLVGERRYEAFCRSGLAAKGAELTVVGLDNFRVIVAKNV
jgi:membrane-bound ClpP family serine protease